MNIAVSEVAQQRTVRLIPTAHYKPAVLLALVDNDEELSIIEKLEGLTSKRVTKGVLGEALDYDAWGRSYISAAFTYCRPSGNRFNSGSYGAWYAGFDDRTSLHEVAYHKTRELLNINYFHDVVQYRAMHASFIGRFHDIRGAASSLECLHADPEIGYPAGQILAKQLLEQGSRGLIYPSVRYKGGTCLVAFRPNAVQDVSPGACWKISWTGTPIWEAAAV